VLVAGEAGVAEAKRQGAGSTIIARWESFARRERIANLRTKLRSAIESEEIEVAYMPLVRLSDGAVIGTEALARWTDAEYGQIPPSEFVAISETNGFVSHLDAYVLERALAAFADGRVEGDELSVNISPRGVGPGFTHAVTTALKKAGVAPTSLVIEVTERAGLTGNPILIASLVALASTGVRIALDDFGAGETAIGHLRTMPIDRLKIDKGLIKDLANDKSGSARAVVDSIAMMADSLGIETLAEGIEEEKQRTEAQGAGVKIGQGFLFGQPLAAVPAGKA
jgi:EAL domain-containing protein (putative c-di-GMP-specific phosphodiesterase class I)